MSGGMDTLQTGGGQSLVRVLKGGSHWTVKDTWHWHGETRLGVTRTDSLPRRLVCARWRVGKLVGQRIPKLRVACGHIWFGVCTNVI